MNLIQSHKRIALMAAKVILSFLLIYLLNETEKTTNHDTQAENFLPGNLLWQTQHTLMVKIHELL